jgi:hypothetical protein
MATIRRELEVEAPLAEVRATWEHFVQWILTGNRRLVCDELACVSAVDSGNVSFEQNSAGTRVAFQLDLPEDGHAPSRDELESHLTHDLLVFKDYVERGGLAAGQPTSVEDITLRHDEDEKGDKPRHVKISAEGETTFWRSHFPS